MMECSKSQQQKWSILHYYSVKQLDSLCPFHMWSFIALLGNLIDLPPCLFWWFWQICHFWVPECWKTSIQEGPVQRQELLCTWILSNIMLNRLVSLGYLPTFVSEQATMLNLWNRRTRAILISSWASLIPTQLRGPAPNGRYTNGCRLALASGVNLRINHIV